MSMKEMLIAHIRAVDNPADLGTKVIPGDQKRDHLISKLLFDLTN